MYRSVLRVTFLGVTCLALACGGDNKVDPAQRNDDLGMPAAVADYGRLPLSFEANRGQTDEQVEFLSRGNGYALFLTPNEAVLTLRDPGALEALVALTAADATPMTMQDQQVAVETESAQGSAPTTLRMRLRGAQRDPQVVGLEQLPGKSNYLIGNDPEEWHTNVPNYARVKYQDVYPGIDLVYYGDQRQLEYDFIIAPGADPRVIRLGFEGAEQLSLDEDGNLSVSVPGGTILQSAPLIYQETVEGTRTTIPGRYVVDGAHEVHFDVAPYDASRPLIIDPVLVFSTFLGGSDSFGGSGDTGTDIAVDTAGNSYVTGRTVSPDFPTSVGAFQPERAIGSPEVFVTKVNAAGDALVYSTYLGGSSGEFGLAIAVDAAGNAFVAGLTGSADFPTKNPIQDLFGGGLFKFDAFVAKLDSTGSALVYSTFLGGSALEFGHDIAVDAAGNAYVTGRAGNSSDFTGMAGTAAGIDIPHIQPSPGGGGANVFVAKINAAGNAFVWATFLSGGSPDAGRAIAVDATGNAYVTGRTSSPNFPGTAGSPIQAAYGGGPGSLCCDNFGGDAFVTKINAAGDALVYSTYLGGSEFDHGLSMAADAAGNAYVAGFTRSSNFPTVNPTQGVYGGDAGTLTPGAAARDGFVAKINAAGDALVFSTFLGGDADDGIQGVAVDAAGNVYVTGSTLSVNFPTTVGAFDTTFDRTLNIFVAKLAFTPWT